MYIVCYPIAEAYIFSEDLRIILFGDASVIQGLTAAQPSAVVAITSGIQLVRTQKI